MCARMMLSEKLKDAIRIVALAELDGPPVEPHEVMTRDRATMLAPRTKIRFRRIAPPPRNDRKTTPRLVPCRVLLLTVPPSGSISMDEARPAWTAAARRGARLRRPAPKWRPNRPPRNA